jgi:hypothetical protein
MAVVSGGRKNHMCLGGRTLTRVTYTSAKSILNLLQFINFLFSGWKVKQCPLFLWQKTKLGEKFTVHQCSLLGLKNETMSVFLVAKDQEFKDTVPVGEGADV